MNTYKRKKRLIDELKEKDYRDAYTASSVDVGVAFQIKALREQKKWNQTRLAEEANMKQERISVLENPSRSPNLSTLKKIANAFDVGLAVRFVPFSDLVKHEISLSSESLNVLSYDQDPYFGEMNGEIRITEATNTVISLKNYLDKKDTGLSLRDIPTSEISNESFVIMH
jgi:transcriptional regulator with XRE-family HTH domain